MRGATRYNTKDRPNRIQNIQNFVILVGIAFNFISCKKKSKNEDQSVDVIKSDLFVARFELTRETPFLLMLNDYFFVMRL